MSLKVVSLNDLLNSMSEKEVSDFLTSFSSMKKSDGSIHDVEFFLKNKALEFEKCEITRTHLVLSTYRKKICIVGYYSLSNKPLTMSKSDWNNLSKSARKKFYSYGTLDETENEYKIPGILIGQLAKNFSDEILNANLISGRDILELAFQSIREINRLIASGKVIYLHCDDNEKIKKFYMNAGFKEYGIDRSNGLIIMVMSLKSVIQN